MHIYANLLQRGNEKDVEEASRSKIGWEERSLAPLGGLLCMNRNAVTEANAVG
jgi:hypothetical protein